MKLSFQSAGRALLLVARVILFVAALAILVYDRNIGTVAEPQTEKAMNSKLCTKCGDSNSLDDFPREPRNRDGRHSHCKKCHKKRLRRWRERNPDRVASALRRQQDREADRLKESHRNYNARNPEKTAAHGAVRLAVRNGTLEKPPHCQDCGAVRAGREIQAHHPDYSKPLEVEWLCRGCHGKRHRAPNRIRSSARRKQDRA